MSDTSLRNDVTTSQIDALRIAHDLVALGVPVFVAAQDSTDADGFRRPSAWQHTEPDHAIVDSWLPGDALCAVMGVACDVIDVDSYKPEAAASEAGWKAAGLWPRAYGTAATASGGAHYLIARLRAGSRDRIAPGIDIKGGRNGDIGDAGRGYIWIAPTERASRATGELTAYTWTIEPNFDGMDEPDEESDELATLVTEAIHRGKADDATAELDPPAEYAALPPKLRKRVDGRIQAVLDRVQNELLEARTMDRDDTDIKGRGWEKITADAAYDLGSFVRATWNNLSDADAKAVFIRSAPTDATWTRRQVEKKWYYQFNRKPVAKQPKWLIAEQAKIAEGIAKAKIPERPLTPEEEALAGSTPFTGPLRLAFRFAKEFSGQFLFVHGIGWHVWDGKRWALDPDKAASRAMQVTLRRALAESYNDPVLDADVRKVQSGTGIRLVLDTASTLETFSTVAMKMDVDPYLVNCANGTLDLRMMELRPHDPADRITKVTRGAYRPDEDGSGAWDRFLERILPDKDVRLFLQRLIGVALYGRVTEQLLPIWTGVQQNGKTTTQTALLFALGDYAMPAEPDLLTSKGESPAASAGQMALLGKRVVFISETDKKKPLSEATMKRLTGSEQITARLMGQNWVDFMPSHMPILITNHLPKVSGDDPAVWRRIRVVPFTEVIPPEEKDAKLAEKLELEADMIVAWAVAGYADYVQRGDRLDEPDAVVHRTKEYREDSDAVGRWLVERCVIGAGRPDLLATTKQLHESYEVYCRGEDGEVVNMRDFGKELDLRGYPAGAPHRGPNNVMGRWRQGVRPMTHDELAAEGLIDSSPRGDDEPDF